MNEQYLFRGKRVDTGEWVEGFVVVYEHRGNKFAQILNDFDDSDEKEISYNMIGVDPATVSQCTGLRDRTGKLIWQGDIVNGKFQNQRTIELICYGEYVSRQYYYYGWYTKDKSIEKYGINGNGGADSGYLSCCTVIGNIHDTPELLKEV